jgi:FlaG/FlaF family flagellin (archaellin)
MKILAKDLKVGMTVKSGYVTVEIKEMQNGFQKNGAATITVTGTGTKNKRTCEGWELVFRELTKVDVN